MVMTDLFVLVLRDSSQLPEQDGGYGRSLLAGDTWHVTGE